MTPIPAGWKPIESAPKDGTPVLLFARHIDAEASTRVVGWFNDDYGWIAQSYIGQPVARLIPSQWAELLPFPGTPASVAPGDAQDERQAFEAWGLAGCEMVDDPLSMRMDIARHCAWEAWQARARIGAPAAGDAREVDPLQGAANWLVQAHSQPCPTVLSACLMIGYNRAQRLYDAAIAAQQGKGGE